MNISTLEKKIQKLQKARDRLMAMANKATMRKLMALPKRVGLKSVAELIAALHEISGKAKRGPAAAKTGKRKKKRAVITAATRAEVKKLAEAGKTGAQIAKAVGISLPSVQNIKKALGLVKPRK